MIAYQAAFELTDNENQPFLQRVIQALPALPDDQKVQEVSGDAVSLGSSHSSPSFNPVSMLFCSFCCGVFVEKACGKDICLSVAYVEGAWQLGKGSCRCQSHTFSLA